MSRTPYLDLNIPDKSSKGFVVTDVFEPNFTKLDQEAERVNLRKMSTEDNIEELKKANIYKRGDVVEVLGFYAKGDGSHHKRIAKAEDDGSGELGQGGIWWCVVHSGEVNVSWFGARGDGVTDDTVAIQRAFDNSDKIILDKGVFCISNHLLVNNKSTISKVISGVGDGTEIKKTSNSTFADPENTSYSVDSCLIITQTDNISKGLIIKNLTINADKKAKNCVYSLPNYRTRLENLSLINYTDIGFYDTGSFVSNYINISTSGAENSNISFYKKNTGTSTTFMNCYSRESKVGFEICGQYTSLINCAVDHYSICAYRIGKDIGSDYYNKDSSTITLQGCGAEKFRGEACNVIELHRGSNVSIDGFMSYSELKMLNIIKMLGSRVKLNVNNFYHFDADFFILDEYNHCDITLNNVYYQGATEILESRIGVNSVLKNLTKGYSAKRGYLNEETKLTANGVYTNTAEHGLGVMLDNKFIKNFTVECQRTPDKHYGTFTIDTGVDLESNGYNLTNLHFSTTLNSTTAHLEERTVHVTAISMSGKSITFAVQGFIGGGTDKYWNKYTLLVSIKFFRNTISALQTNEHALKMQQEGVYEEYAAYRDELHEYENGQTSDETMLLAVLQEPEIPKSVKAFAEKYKLI